MNGHKTVACAPSEIEEKLQDTLFACLHRSFIIALEKIKAFNSSCVVIQGKHIPIGRMYSEVLSNTLKANKKIVNLMLNKPSL